MWPCRLTYPVSLFMFISVFREEPDLTSPDRLLYCPMPLCSLLLLLLLLPNARCRFQCSSLAYAETSLKVHTYTFAAWGKFML